MRSKTETTQNDPAMSAADYEGNTWSQKVKTTNCIIFLRDLYD